MGNSADELTRLWDEIKAWRGAREAFLEDLARGVKEMLAGFHNASAERAREIKEMLAGFQNAHAEMARETKAEREAFVSDLKENGRKAKAEREAFVSDLKEKVSDMRTEFATDIAATHQAWLLGSAKGRDAARK